MQDLYPGLKIYILTKYTFEEGVGRGKYWGYLSIYSHKVGDKHYAYSDGHTMSFKSGDTVVIADPSDNKGRYFPKDLNGHRTIIAP